MSIMRKKYPPEENAKIAPEALSGHQTQVQLTSKYGVHSKLSVLQKKALKDPEVKKAYEDMAFEFTVAKELIAQRLEAKMTQEEVAEKMGTTQPVVTRLESGSRLPALRTIERYARALGKDVKISFRRQA